MFLYDKFKKKLYYFKVVVFAIFIFSLSLGIAVALSDEKLYIDAATGGVKGVVIIDAGHGGEDSGAIGKNGALEKDLNLQVAMKLGEYLTNAGYSVIYTRSEDKLLYTEEQNIKGFRKIYDLKNRLAVAEQYPDAYFISLHMNSFGDEQYSGLQVYYSDNNAQSRILAESIQKNVKEKLQPTNNRSIKSGKDIYLLENSVGKAVLVECGFLTNEQECRLLCEKEYQKELCFAIMCGIISYEDK